MAELTAIVNASDWVYHSDGKDVVIYIDPKSMIESMTILNSFRPLVQKAQEWLFCIVSRRKSVCFCWIPSKVGIKGNEIANREAKDAMSSALSVIKKVPHSDMNKPVR